MSVRLFSTTDAIFILQNAINLSSAPLYVCFIDLKAAYDWIDRDMLFKVLEIRLNSPFLVKILKVLYTGTSAAIKGSKKISKHSRDVGNVAWSPR